MAVLTRKNRSEVPEKIVLTYGTLYVPYFVKTDVVAFNKQSEKYRIEIKEYGEGDKDYETMICPVETGRISSICIIAR